MEVNDTLAERGGRYGDFMGHAKYTQNLKRILQSSPNWATMADDQRESLEMVMHKVGRILNGDPDYADSWHDIAGYAKLVDDRLEGKLIPGVTVPAVTKAPETVAPVNAVFPKAPEPVAPVSPTVAAPAAPSAQKPAAPSPISPIGTEAKK